MNDINNKTIFVLDHTPYFGISGETIVDLEVDKNKILPPVTSITKSLWTLAVEASVEYCRIVWDLYPNGKLIRFVVSDQAASIVNTWNVSTQNLTHVMNAMSMVGIPPRGTSQTQDFSVIHGLRAAIDAIAEPTDFQKEYMGKNDKLQNNGRVICITSARDDASMKSLEDIFNTVLVQQNSQISNHKDFLKIDNCHLVIINLYPSNMDTLVTNRDLLELSVNLSTEIHSIVASRISNKLTHLLLPHFDLASTTVTGIPMKEEQNASSSANYDVEIFHGSRAHSVFLGTDLVLPKSIKEDSEYETVTLKWCTPRSCSGSEMQPCLVMCRVTPVDVTSRPSSCLINFLLNGRSVLLEMPKKTGGKLISHLLSAHGGEIFIHSLNTSRSVLEDPPSISEGFGGRITDYRINEFGTLMQKFRLVPLKSHTEREHDENLQKVRTKLSENTRYWPLTLSSTILYNARVYVDPILLMIQKEELTDDDVLQCQKCIFNVVSLEARHEQLNLPGGNSHRSKSNKKEEQYRLLWSELDAVVSTSGHSVGHKAVLKCLRDCRASGPDQSVEKMELDNAVKDLDPSADVSHRASVIKVTTESPLSPPPIHTHIESMPLKRNTKTLFEILAEADEKKASKRADFCGRIDGAKVAKLYPYFGQKEVEDKSN